jgi:hypothetical protein
MFWKKSASLLRQQYHPTAYPFHIIYNGCRRRFLRIGSISSIQYLLIPHTKKNISSQVNTNMFWCFCASWNIKKLWSGTALYIFDVWAARCYWQLLFHLVNMGMKKFQLLLCLICKRYDLLSFADGIDSFLLHTPKIIIHSICYLNALQNHYSQCLCKLLLLTKNNIATYEGFLCLYNTYIYI